MAPGSLYTFNPLSTIFQTSTVVFCFKSLVHHFPPLIPCLQWFSAVFQTSPLLFKGLFCAAIWYIWNEHNRRVHGELKEDAIQLGLRIMEVEKGTDDQSLRATKLKSSKPILKWAAPKSGWLKLNVDAAIGKEGGTAKAGYVIRDERGKVILAGVAAAGDCLSSLHAEMKALFIGLQAAQQAGFRSVIAASDSLHLVNLCTRKSKEDGVLYYVLQQVLSLASEFEKLVFMHERREANSIAHTLAKHVLHRDKSIVFAGDIPTFLKELAVKDFDSPAN